MLGPMAPQVTPGQAACRAGDNLARCKDGRVALYPSSGDTGEGTASRGCCPCAKTSQRR